MAVGDPAFEAREWMMPFQPYALLAGWDGLSTKDKSVGILSDY